MSHTSRDALGTFSGCPSSLTLERWIFGALKGSSSAEWSGHIAECPHCAARLQDMRAVGAQFMTSVTASRIRREIVRASRGESQARQFPEAFNRVFKWARWAVPPALAFVAVLVVLRWPHEERFIEKGHATLRAVVEHAGRQRAMAEDSLSEGDRIQLLWSGSKDGYLAVLGIEPSGTVTVLFPESGSTAAFVSASHEQRLGGSVVARRSLSGAQIVGLFDEHVFALGPVVEEVKRQGANVEFAGETSLIVLPLVGESVE